MPRKIIEIQNYSYTYPGQNKAVLNDVNLCVEEGETCLLLGRSGCGKSTLCLSLNGIIPHMLGGKTKGNVIVAGKNVSESEVKDLAKITAIVFQNPDHQLCNIEVKNEVAFALENLLFEPDDIRIRVSEALKFVGLEGYDMKNVWDLSGGEKQRLAIASALALKPKILILDEPTSNLDPRGTLEILNTIEKIRKGTNCTVILVEHNLDELMSNVNKVLVMDEGTIVYDEPPRKIIDEKGDYLLNNLGLWLPQYSIIGLKARKKFSLPSIPLTIDEAVKIFKKHVAQVEFTQQEREKNEAIVEVQNLHFTYPDGTKALNGINLRIRKGDMVAIVGKNGSGKSTLALHFVGIHKPSSGKVIVEGYDTQKVSITDLVKKVSYVFQYPEHQFVEGTVFEEVAYSVRSRGLSKEEIEKTSCDMLSSLGLLQYRERHPTLLSMGQMRRLSVAAMLITKPSLIVLDEPTYGQDRNSARTLMNYIVNLNKDGKTIVLITHDMKLVAEYVKTVVVLNNGRVVFEGSPREVFSNKEVLSECCLMPPPVFRLSDQIAGMPILTEDEFISILKE